MATAVVSSVMRGGISGVAAGASADRRSSGGRSSSLGSSASDVPRSRFPSLANHKPKRRVLRVLELQEIRVITPTTPAAPR